MRPVTMKEIKTENGLMLNYDKVKIERSNNKETKRFGFRLVMLN